MQAVRQPAQVPGEFLERVIRWAQEQPAPVSVILSASRARGDHVPESDWDTALVCEGGARRWTVFRTRSGTETLIGPRSSGPTRYAG